jgi:hypothetical protein
MRPLILAALLLLATPPAFAQTADTSRVGAVLGGACPGARVRLYRDAGGPAQGICGPVTDARLVVQEDGTTAALPVTLASVTYVFVEERATGRGARIGGGIGAGTLMVMTYVVVRGLCEGGCTGDLVVGLPLAALVGGGVGGLVGGGIGYLTKVWVRRYP